MGRPSLYTEELAIEIVEEISTSNMGLYRLCEAHDHWPDYSTVKRWINNHSEFRANYARAREEQADFIADEIIEIADSADKESYNEARLQVDARKWKASKLYPKVYGEKIQQEITGDLKHYVIAVPKQPEDETEWLEAQKVKLIEGKK